MCRKDVSNRRVEIVCKFSGAMCLILWLLLAFHHDGGGKDKPETHIPKDKGVLIGQFK